MTSDPAKISFIPKNSLIGQDPILSRRRPRSILGVVATIFFLLNIAVYVGIYVYKVQLANQIKERTTAISATHKTFKSSQVIAQAKVFQARAEIGKEVLNNHVSILPIFDFISENTLQSILFRSFDFKYHPDGSRVVLKGEVPGYASLAFQSDVLKEKQQELLGFSVRDVELTSLGSVTFSLEQVISPSFTSYIESAKKVKDIDSIRIGLPAVSPGLSSTVVPAEQPVPVEALSMEPVEIVDAKDGKVVATTTRVATTKASTAWERLSLTVISWKQKFFDLFK